MADAPPALTPPPDKKSHTVRRIVIVDDHPIIRHGMAALINEEEDLEVCAEAGTYISGLEAVHQHNPDAVTVDLGLPDINGMELIKVLHAGQPRLPILVVSMHDESEYALRALRAGAGGYLTKSDVVNNIVTGLRKVMEGQIFLSPEFGDRLIFQMFGTLDNPQASPVERLTLREREVLDLIGHGLGTGVVAQRLGISVKTVETHRGHLKEKLKLTSSAHLTQFASDWVAQME